MQATARFHDSVTNAILQEADLICHDPVALPPANGLFNPEAEGRDPTIRRCLRRGEFPTTRFLLGLDNRDAGQDDSREAHSLIETTAGGQALALAISSALSVCLPFIGSTQEAKLTSCIDHQEGVDRLTRRLATGILLLLFGIPRAMEGSLSPLMPKRGDVVPSFVCLRVRSVAHSPAVRAGSSSGWAKA
jgi:hypothetical protein